ncbi:hypothetical protein [Methylobacterium pseudosasicola]|uniref:Uncharacterized protein n=1 Tax=Methylobacterium pseudosasicola TaxID=582667 RepID=A0A1I4U0H7_9HYPH|nr:hypothetical protein [Methylobacterium pseudosasicola]SFM82534.1 hypothetical protein SAMN05192568_106122 [Methylobacterium pseudosasicola]
MSEEDRRLVATALRELHSAVSDLRDATRSTVSEGMWPDTERLTFAPIDTALSKAGVAIEALRGDGE